jgi:anti-sigma regulatory factor (Ser/Thr protein kinase)
MTTEVQIRKNRRYLPHLRKIVACIASRLGMSGADITQAEDAVSEICGNSIDRSGGESDENLSIRLETRDRCLTVEISDPRVDFDPVCSTMSAIGEYSLSDLGRVIALTDGVELISGDEGTTIRLTKYAERLRAPCALDMQVLQSSLSPTANLQA